jgi:hypothetical protein
MPPQLKLIRLFLSRFQVIPSATVTRLVQPPLRFLRIWLSHSILTILVAGGGLPLYLYLSPLFSPALPTYCPSAVCFVPSRHRNSTPQFLWRMPEAIPFSASSSGGAISPAVPSRLHPCRSRPPTISPLCQGKARQKLLLPTATAYPRLADVCTICLLCY